MNTPASAKTRPTRSSVGRLASLSLLGAVLDRFFTLLLVAVMAAVYGASSTTDQYFLALVVPVALGGTLTEALYAALVPVFAQGHESRVSVLGSVQRTILPSVVGITVVYLAVLMIIQPERLALWLTFVPIIVALSANGVYAAYLVSRHRYAIAVLRVPLATGLALLLIGIFLPIWRSILLVAVALSAANLLATAALAALALRRERQDPPGKRAGYSGGRIFTSSASAFGAGLVGGPLVVVVERLLASSLAAGSVSILTFARNLGLLPLMLASAVASGMFPAAAAKYSASEYGSFRRLIIFTLRNGSLIALCGSALFLICRREIVRIALERGSFDASQGRVTSHIVGIIAIAVIGLSVATIGGRALLAMQRFGLMAWISAVTLVLYICMAVILRAPYGLEGLAFAFVGSAFFAGTLTAVATVRHLPGQNRHGARSLATTICFGGAFAGGAYIAWRLTPLDGIDFWSSAATIGSAAFGGAAALGCAMAFFRICRGPRLNVLPRDADSLRPGE